MTTDNSKKSETPINATGVAILCAHLNLLHITYANDI